VYTDITTNEIKVQNCKIFYYDSIIFYLATRDIMKGEELWTDYGESYFEEFTNNLS
jgi:SET domain-containing protein